MKDKQIIENLTQKLEEATKENLQLKEEISELAEETKMFYQEFGEPSSPDYMALFASHVVLETSPEA